MFIFLFLYDFHLSFVKDLPSLIDPLSGNDFPMQVFKHYFEELEEESLRDNFVVVVRGIFSLLKTILVKLRLMH